MRSPLLLFLALTLSINCCLAEDLSTWPTLHRDNQRSGYTPQAPDGKLTHKWFRGFGEELINPYSEPIVAEGKVFAGTYHGNLYAMNIEDGSDAWEPVRTEGRIGNSPCYADGNIYFGVDLNFNQGMLYCVDAGTGETKWVSETKAGIWSSPVCDGATIYIGDRSGEFYAIDAKSGSIKWSHQTDYMIIQPASISLDGQRIVVGSEDMHVYCFSPEGKLLWKSEKIEGVTQRHYAPTIWNGNVIVRTSPSSGFHPALASYGLKKEHLARTKDLLPAEDWTTFAEADKEQTELKSNMWRIKDKEERKQAQAKIKALTNRKQEILATIGEKIWWDDWGQFKMRWTETRYDIEMDIVRERLQEDPGQRTFYVFRLEDGTCPWPEQPPVLYQSGKSAPGGPCAFNPATNDIYVWGSGTLSNMSVGVPGNTGALFKIDPQTGMPEFINHKDRNHDEPGGFGGAPFSQPADETQNLSFLGPDTLLNTHMGTLTTMNLKTRKINSILNLRDTYGGLFGPRYFHGKPGGAHAPHWEGKYSVMPNQWHGPGKGICAIAENRLFWIDGSHVICMGGEDIPATEKMVNHDNTNYLRSEKPVWPGGNWSFVKINQFDESVKRPEVTTAWLKEVLKPFPAAPVNPSGKLTQILSALLDDEVAELISAKWRPLHYQMGFTGTEIQFDRTSETLRVLSQALPYLSDEARQDAVAYLDNLWDQGYPLEKSTFKITEGQPREFFRTSKHEEEKLEKGRKRNPTHKQGDILDIAGIWAYAHFADRWDTVLSEKNRITQLWVNARPATYEVGSQHEKGPQDKDRFRNGEDRINAWITGTMAYALIMEKAGDIAGAEKAHEKLTSLLADRVWLELGDGTFILGNEHRAKLARYRNTSPMLLRALHELAGDVLNDNLDTLTRQGANWHHSWGDLQMGGENFTHSPRLARGIFLAIAYGSGDTKTLRASLDQPQCKADLYYIEKLTAFLEALNQ